MPLPVYSTRFIAQELVTGSLIADYVVPDGFRAIVRELTTVTFATAGSEVWWNIKDLITFMVQAPAATITARAAATWSGRLVLEPGETLRAVCNSNPPADVSASGYLLSLP